MWTRHIYLLRLSRLAKGRESGGVRQPDGLAVRVLGDGAVEAVERVRQRRVGVGFREDGRVRLRDRGDDRGHFARGAVEELVQVERAGPADQGLLGRGAVRVDGRFGAAEPRAAADDEPSHTDGSASTRSSVPRSKSSSSTGFTWYEACRYSGNSPSE